MIRLCYTVATPDTADASMLALRGPIAESFALLSKHGYHAAELMVRDPSRLSASKILGQARDHGLAIPAVSTGQLRKEDDLSLCATDTLTRARALDRMQSVLEFAAAFGAIVNIGTLRGQLPPTASEREAALAAARESFDVILDRARTVGVTLAIEPQCRYVVNWLNTVDATNTWNRQFGNCGPRILFDVYHAILEEQSVHASLVRHYQQIAWIQVSDTNRRAPGLGHWSFAETFRLLDALGHESYVSVECLQDPDSSSAVLQASQCLKPLLGG